MSNVSGSPDNATWMWRTIIGIILAGIVTVTERGCSAVTNLRDRLMIIEGDMRLMGMDRTNLDEQMTALDNRLIDFSKLVVNKFDQISNKLDRLQERYYSLKPPYERGVNDNQ